MKVATGADPELIRNLQRLVHLHDKQCPTPKRRLAMAPKPAQQIILCKSSATTANRLGSTFSRAVSWNRVGYKSSSKGMALRGSPGIPSIFEKAIVNSAETTKHRLREASLDPPIMALYEQLAISRTYNAPPTRCAQSTMQSNGRDGIVSLEVSPFVADERR